MKNFALATSALLLSGCWGGNDKSAYVEYCVGTGAGSKGYCSCQFDFAQTELDPEVWAVVVAGAKGDHEEAQRLRNELGMNGFFNAMGMVVILANFESKTKQQCGG